jgi:hypothetical protein
MIVLFSNRQMHLLCLDTLDLEENKEEQQDSGVKDLCHGMLRLDPKLVY